MGLFAGLLGAVAAILVTETLAFEDKWIMYAIGSVISIGVAVQISKALYGKYVEFTKDSQDAIRRADQARKQR